MFSVAIIGAGCSGLAATHELRDAGFSVTIFEQSQEVGGRVATRKRQGFIYDYGAQYIKSGSPVSIGLITERFRLADLIDIAKPVWIFDQDGHIQEGDPVQNAEPKWNYRSGLNALAKCMAQGLDIQLQTRIDYLQQSSTGWKLFDNLGHLIGEFQTNFSQLQLGGLQQSIEFLYPHFAWSSGFRAGQRVWFPRYRGFA